MRQSHRWQLVQRRQPQRDMDKKISSPRLKRFWWILPTPTQLSSHLPTAKDYKGRYQCTGHNIPFPPGIGDYTTLSFCVRQMHRTCPVHILIYCPILVLIEHYIVRVQCVVDRRDGFPGSTSFISSKPSVGCRSSAMPLVGCHTLRSDGERPARPSLSQQARC